MGKQLVLVGGGHAHMVTLANLYKFIEKGYKVTVIGPSPYHYYSGMGPGMLGKVYTPEDIRFATKNVVEKQGGSFVLGKAVRVDPDERTVQLESGDTVSYDVLSFNVGSYVSLSTVKGDDYEDIYSVKPIEKLIEAQARILELGSQKKINVSIIGGGPSSAEIAGNVWRLTRDFDKNKPVIRIFAGENYMAHFPENIRKMVAGSLTKRGIEILEGSYVKAVQTGVITTESGQRYNTDFIFLALGVKPSSIFVESGLVFVWDKDVDDVGLFGQVGGRDRLEAVFDGQLVIGRALEIRNQDVDAAVAQVLGLGVALAAVTDDADGFPAQVRQIGIVIVVKLCHEKSPPRSE